MLTLVFLLQSVVLMADTEPSKALNMALPELWQPVYRYQSSKVNLWLFFPNEKTFEEKLMLDSIKYDRKSYEELDRSKVLSREDSMYIEAINFPFPTNPIEVSQWIEDAFFKRCDDEAKRVLNIYDGYENDYPVTVRLLQCFDNNTLQSEKGDNSYWQQVYLIKIMAASDNQIYIVNREKLLQMQVGTESYAPMYLLEPEEIAYWIEVMKHIRFVDSPVETEASNS